MKKLLGIVVMGMLLSLNISQVFAQEEIPEWYINIPKETENIIYSRGTATSTVLYFSHQKALINALEELCIKIHYRITKKNNTIIFDSECKSPKYEIHNEGIIKSDNGIIRTFIILKHNK